MSLKAERLHRSIQSFRIQFQGGFAPTECQVGALYLVHSLQYEASFNYLLMHFRFMLLVISGNTLRQVSVGGGDIDGPSAVSQANGGEEGGSGAEEPASRQGAGEAVPKLLVLTTVYPQNTNDIQDFELPSRMCSVGRKAALCIDITRSINVCL